MNNNKKILLVYYKLFKPGGVAKVMTNLANELVREGYDVEILLLHREESYFYPLDKKVKVHHIDTFSHWAWSICEFNVKYLKFIPKIKNLNAYIYHIGVYLMLKNWLKHHHQNYDTIISCWYKLTSFIGLIGGQIAKKSIAWEHTDYNVGGFIYKGILRRYYKNLKGTICINSPSINYYKKLNRTNFIANIIGESFEKKPFIPSNKKENTIIFVGRLDKDKNVKDLISTFLKANITSDWTLQIIGDGPERKTLEALSQSVDYKKIEFLGQKSTNDIMELLEKSKIFGFTSLKEGLPTVLLEAMFSSNALIAYDCNYGPSDIINKNNGFLVPLGDKQMFQEKLKYLTQNVDTLNMLMESSYKESQNWKKDKIIEQWKKII